MKKMDDALQRAESLTLRYENGREINHTWFCGYFAVKEKTYVVAIFKEDGISGANDCASVFKEISENMLQLD